MLAFIKVLLGRRRYAIGSVGFSGEIAGEEDDLASIEAKGLALKGLAFNRAGPQHRAIELTARNSAATYL